MCGPAPGRTWAVQKPRGCSRLHYGPQLDLRVWGWCHNESHTHSTLEIAERGLGRAASRRRPAPGHSWQSPSCTVSSTGMCLDRRTTYLIFCWGHAR